MKNSYLKSAFYLIGCIAMGMLLPSVIDHRFAPFLASVFAPIIAWPVFVIGREGRLSEVLKFFLPIGLLGLLIESFGVFSCFPYGCFSYGELFFPLFFGLAPLALIFIWPVLVVAAAFVHERILIGKFGIKSLLAPTMLLVAFDILLDPAAVSLGFWFWPEGGIFYGVPLVNFFGWSVSGFLSLKLFFFIKKRFDFALLQKFSSLCLVSAVGCYFLFAGVAWAGGFFSVFFLSILAFVLLFFTFQLKLKRKKPIR